MQRTGASDGDGLSLAAALRTPAFWVFGGATSLFGLVSSGLGLFNEAVLAERGFDQQTYVRFLAATSIIALAGQLACGWLTLRWSMQRLLGLAMFIYAAALAALPLLTTLSQLWIFAALIGLSGGMITVHVLRGLAAGVRSGAPGPDSGRRADADRAGVGDRTADFRAVPGADRFVHAGSLDPGAVRAAPEPRGVSRRDARPESRRTCEVIDMAGAIDETLRKFHASLNVADLDRSIAFYRVLLGAEPAKVRADYAKFDLAEPPLVLSLIPGRPGAGGNLNHVGLRVRNAEELVEIQRRLEAAGLPHRARRRRRVLLRAADEVLDHRSGPRALGDLRLSRRHRRSRQRRAASCGATPGGAPRARRRRSRGNTGFGIPFPSRIPHDDNTLHEVRLEGSINVAPEADNRPVLLAESLRALRPGADDPPPRPCRRSPEPFEPGAARPGRGRAARAGHQ